MMKRIIYIFLATFVFCIIKLNAQCQISIDTVLITYFNGVIEQPEIIENYKINNNSNEDYFTWISLVPTKNKSYTDLVYDFFKKTKGDFSYTQMMYENLLDAQNIAIGYSFIKNIKAGETFTYTIVKGNTNSKFYQNRIVILKRTKIEECLRGLQLKEKYFYQFSNIVLIEKK